MGKRTENDFVARSQGSYLSPLSPDFFYGEERGDNAPRTLTCIALLLDELISVIWLLGGYARLAISLNDQVSALTRVKATKTAWV
jgi:hypothetical protein